MKKLLLAGLVLTRLTALAVDKGLPRHAVLEELGEPQGTMIKGSREILLYKNGTVTLLNGTVAETDLSAAYEQQSEKRAQELENYRAEKQAGLERQKLLYPENHVTRTVCTYSKTENWDHLPESIRPAPGEYLYDLYIPQGYYESAQKSYPCLFLESPALWDSVKERIRKEKWIVVILPDTAQQQAGRAVNGNFLAAYDDVTGRFRTAGNRRFITGRVPAAIFASMRSADGIILHEPDFRGFEKAGFYPDFTRKSPELRAYVLIGNRDRANMDYQAQSAMTLFPKHFIGVYEGSVPVLPETFADQAVDWLKKEYNLP